MVLQGNQILPMMVCPDLQGPSLVMPERSYAVSGCKELFHGMIFRANVLTFKCTERATETVHVSVRLSSVKAVCKLLLMLPLLLLSRVLAGLMLQLLQLLQFFRLTDWIAKVQMRLLLPAIIDLANLQHFCCYTKAELDIVAKLPRRYPGMQINSIFFLQTCLCH